MAQVTNGVIEYGRVRKDDDYGINRSSKVQLTYTVDANEDPEAATAKVGDIAQRRVNALVFPEKQQQPATEAKAPVVQTPVTPASDKAKLAEAAGAPKEEKKTRASKPPKVELAASAEESVVEPEPAKPAANSEAGIGEEDLLAGAAPEINDTELTSKVTHRAQATKNSAEIRKLIGKYGCIAPKTVKDLPQELRAKFLEELEKVPTLTP